MKKFLIASSSIASYLLLASNAFAANAIDLCPGTLEGVCKKPELATVINRVIVYLLLAAAVIALIFLIWGGIKWITSGGDKTKVESARSTVIGAIIGLIIAFAAFFLLNLVLSLLFGQEFKTFTVPNLLETTVPNPVQE